MKTVIRTENREQRTENREQRTENRQRIDWVDFGKGVTVFLVVLGHVILGLFDSNRFESHNTWLLFLTQVIYLYHIPVFFALSGFFFKPLANGKELLKSTLQKTLNLGIPYLFYSIIQFSLQRLGGASVRLPASLSDLLQIWRLPLGVSWYLYSLWWIYLIIGLLSIWLKKSNLLMLVSSLAFLVNILGLVESYLLQKLTLWSFFFVLGYWLHQTGLFKTIAHYWKQTLLISLVTVICFLVFWQRTNPEYYISYDTPGFWGLIFPVSVFLAFAWYPRYRPSSALGKYVKQSGKDSLVIYLLHAPLVSITRIVLLKFGIDQVVLHLIIGLGVGWFGSQLAVLILEKVPFVDVVFYPQKYIKKDIIKECSSGNSYNDSRQQTADSRQQTADSRQQTADSRQQTADSNGLTGLISARALPSF